MIPALEKSSFRSAGKHCASIPAPGNRQYGKRETGIPVIWEPLPRRDVLSVEQRPRSNHSLRLLSSPYTSHGTVVRRVCGDDVILVGVMLNPVENRLGQGTVVPTELVIPAVVMIL